MFYLPLLLSLTVEVPLVEIVEVPKVVEVPQEEVEVVGVVGTKKSTPRIHT